MAIDDEIDQAQLQIEYAKTTVAPKVVTGFFEVLSAVGVKKAKPIAYLLQKVFKQREDNVQYLLDATISRLRGLEKQVETFTAEHKLFIEEKLPQLLIEATHRTEQTRSKERIDRLSLIVVHTVVQGPSSSLEEVDEQLRITIDLAEEDIDILCKIYDSQFRELSFLKFMPERNVVNSSWKQLQDSNPIFKSSEIYSICSKLQSLGLIAQVPPINTTLDLTSMPYGLLLKGANYLKAIERR